MKSIKRILIYVIIFIGITSTANAAGVYGTLDLTDYNESEHDLKGNTLAILVEMDGGGGGGGTISNCTLVLFDKKANEKIRVVFPEAVGSDKIDITHFDKTWALLEVDDGTDTTYYSVKLGKTGVSILGSALDSEFRFRFASGKNLVSVLNQDNLAQLFNQKMEKIGLAVNLIGGPHSLNSGKYFVCDDGANVKIYKVKKGFEEVISEVGDYKEINELKRICCIRDGDFHKICKY